MKEETLTDLGHLRQQLDQIDEDFMQLIAKRMDLVREIIKVKSTKNDGIKDSIREREIMAHIEKIARDHNISVVFAKKIFREILNHSLSEQAKDLGSSQNKLGTQRLTIAFQGIDNAYSHLSAQAHFTREQDNTDFVGLETFKEVAAAVSSGSADFGVLPIENTTAGSINQVYDLLLESDLYIVGEEILKVEHCLIGLEEVPLHKIRKIISHPQAIEQCTTFLGTMKNAFVESFFDTAGAVKKVADDKDPYQAALGSVESAEACGLIVLRRNITNQDENYTRFVVLSRNPVQYDLRIPCKTSLILATRDERGALVKCLQIFNKYELNMIKLESRPRMNRPWEYLFYLDFEGNMADPKVEKALDELKGESPYVKILGSYPSKSPPSEAAVTNMEDFHTTVEAPLHLKPSEVAAAPVIFKSKHYKLVSREYHAEDTLIRVGDILIGKDGFVIMAGPCSVETPDQINQAARYIKEHGGHILRGGVFKPRTSPYSFQGLGWEGLDLLYEAGKRYGLPIITEVLAPEQVKGIAAKADILQIGARNMQNFPLLREVGKVHRPVLLKRGLSSTLEELLAAAEYIVAQGNSQVILCERGIRTFETATRNTLDLSAVPVLKERTHLPIIIDPSHGTGNRRYVIPMSLAAHAVGAHGLLVEVHPEPDKALSDGDQSVTLDEFGELMRRLRS